MIRRLTTILEFPIHTFLVALYFILFVYTSNFNSLEFSSTLRIIIVSLICTAILFFTLKKLFKNAVHAGVFVTFLLFGFFTYGLFYNNLEKLYYAGFWPFKNIHRYEVIGFVAFYLFMFVWILLTKRKLIRVNRFLNLLFICLLAINVLTIGFYTLKRSTLNEAPLENVYLSDFKKKQVKKPKFAARKLPDIYYIILDGYANQRTLTKYYNYDNSQFVNYLKGRGFYIADSSQTNYPVTSLSLSSSLNLNYLDIQDEQSAKMPLEHLIAQNLATYIFKQHGYKIINISSGYNVTRKLELADKTYDLHGPNEFERSILRSGIFRLDDLTGFMAYYRLKEQFQNMTEAIKEQGPKFTFVHIVCPHPPFVFKSDGSLNLHTISDLAWSPKEDYVEQLAYVNRVAKNYIDEIFYNSGVEPIIILQSDHGPWMESNSRENSYESRSYILNAFRLPASIKDKLYDSISPVNCFRFIDTHVLNDTIPLLLDKPLERKTLYANPIFKNYVND